MSRKISFNHKLINKNTLQIIRTDTTENLIHIFNKNSGIEGGVVYDTETCDNSISVGQGNVFNSQDYGSPNGIYVHITDNIEIQEVVVTHSTNSTNNNGNVKVTMKTPSNGYWYILEKKNEDNSYSVFKIYTTQLKTHTFTGLMGNKVYRIIVRDIRYYDTTRTWDNNQRFIYTEPFQIHDNYDIQYTQILTQPLVNQINTAKYTITPISGYPPYTITLKRLYISSVEIIKTINNVGELCEFKDLVDRSIYKVTIKDRRIYKNEQTINSSMRVFSSFRNDSIINGVRPTVLSNDNAKIIIYGSTYGEQPYIYEIYNYGDTTPISGYTYETQNKDEIVTFYNLIGGLTYNIKLKDGRGSSFDSINKQLYIKNVPVKIYNYEVIKPTDANNNDGIIKIYISGGLMNEDGGYYYVIKNLTTDIEVSGTTIETYHEFNNLTVATYQITIKDGYDEMFVGSYKIIPYNVVYLDESNIDYQKNDPLNSITNDGYIHVKVFNLPGGILDNYFRYELRDSSNLTDSLGVIEHNTSDVNSDTSFAEFNNLKSGDYVLLIKTLKTEYNNNGLPYFNIKLQIKETSLEYEIINDIYFEDDLTNMIIDPVTETKYSDLLNGFVFNIKRSVNSGDYAILSKSISKNKLLTYDVNLNRTRLRQINTYISPNSDILKTTNNYNYSIGNLNLEYNEFENPTPKLYSLGDSNDVNISSNGNNLIINKNTTNPIKIGTKYNISDLGVKINELKLEVIKYQNESPYGETSSPEDFIDRLYFYIEIDITLNGGIFVFNNSTKFDFYKLGVNLKYTKTSETEIFYTANLVLSDFEEKNYTFNNLTKTVKLSIRKMIAENTNGFSSFSIDNNNIIIIHDVDTYRVFKISNDDFVTNIYTLSPIDTTLLKNTTYNYLQSSNQIESSNNEIDVNIKLLSHQTHFNYGNESINVFNEIKKSSLSNDGSVFIRILGGYPLYDVKLFLDENVKFTGTTELITNITNLIGDTTYKLVVNDSNNNTKEESIIIGKDINFITVSVIATKPSVIDNNDGRITINVSPGYGETFTYILKYNDVILKKVVNGTSNTFTNLDGGLIYTVIVSNGVNNSYVGEINIESYISSEKPPVVTSSYLNVKSTSIDFYLTIEDSGDSNIMKYGIYWDETSIAEVPNNSNNNEVYFGEELITGFEIKLINLKPNTEYSIRPYAYNQTSIGYGEISYITTDKIPQLGLPNLYDITPTDATYESDLIYPASVVIGDCGFCYGEYPSIEEPTKENSNVVSGTIEVNETWGYNRVRTTLPNLIIGTYYSVRSFFDDGENIGYSEVIIHNHISKPSVLTTIAYVITSNSVMSGGQIISNGGNNITEYGVEYSIYSTFVGSNKISITGSITDGQTFNSELTDLIPNNYYYRAYAKNNIGTAYGNIYNFNIYGPPVLELLTIDNILSDSADITFEKINNGNSNLINDKPYGICFALSSVTQNPNINNSSYIRFVEYQDYNPIKRKITGLEVDKTYSVRAFAINEKFEIVGIGYSNSMSFTTKTTPNIEIDSIFDSSVDIYDYSQQTVVLKNINGNGYEVVDYGVTWGLQENPTIEDNYYNNDVVELKTKITGLSEGQKYYVRAYITTTETTAYSSTQTITAKTVIKPVVYLYTENTLQFGRIRVFGEYSYSPIIKIGVEIIEPNNTTKIIKEDVNNNYNYTFTGYTFDGGYGEYSFKGFVQNLRGFTGYSEETIIDYQGFEPIYINVYSSYVDISGNEIYENKTQTPFGFRFSIKTNSSTLPSKLNFNYQYIDNDSIIVNGEYTNLKTSHYEVYFQSLNTDGETFVDIPYDSTYSGFLTNGYNIIKFDLIIDMKYDFRDFNEVNYEQLFVNELKSKTSITITNVIYNENLYVTSIVGETTNIDNGTYPGYLEAVINGYLFPTQPINEITITNKKFNIDTTNLNPINPYVNPFDLSIFDPGYDMLYKLFIKPSNFDTYIYSDIYTLTTPSQPTGDEGSYLLLNVEDNINRISNQNINAEIYTKNPNNEKNDNGEIKIVVTTGNLVPITFKCKKKNVEDSEIVVTVNNNTYTFANLGGGIDNTENIIIYTITIIDFNYNIKKYDIIMYNVKKVEYSITQKILLEPITPYFISKLLNNNYNIDYNKQNPVLWETKRNVNSGIYQIEYNDDSIEITQVDTFVDYIEGGLEYNVSINNFGLKYFNENKEQRVEYLTQSRLSSVTLISENNINIFDGDINKTISFENNDIGIYNITIKHLKVDYNYKMT